MFAELTTLNAAAASTTERAMSVLAEHGQVYLQGVYCSDHHREALSHSLLRVDPSTFTVQWNGQRCHLGPTILFKLMQQLARRPGRYFTYDILMEDVWQRRCSNTTVRSAVKRLRRAISDAGMSELASAIKGRGQCYGLFFEKDGH